MFSKSRFDVFTSNKSTICGMSQISRTYTTNKFAKGIGSLILLNCGKDVNEWNAIVNMHLDIFSFANFYR